MRRELLLAAVLMAALTMTGCNQAQPESKPPANAGGSTSQAVKPAHSPEEAVGDFLTAIRDRNEERARSLLTPVARDKTKNLALLSKLQVTQKAKFAVADVEYLEDASGAHVASTWTDYDESGEAFTDEVVWILRKEEQEGWRIAGMAMKVFADEPPVIFNYEDPEDTVRKHELLEEEFARRDSAGEASEDQEAAADNGAPPAARQADRRSQDR